MKSFVPSNSIVRKIWQHTDVVLFIFGASAGEFALHKAVDWLFFTGKLPSDPVGRLFSTVIYAQKIIFEDEEKALKTLQMMKQIHQNIEDARGFNIPNWAYQDVLYMLIAYSITCYELWERPLTEEEKAAVYAVFKRVGEGMGLQELPENYVDWLIARKHHLANHFQKSDLSLKLFAAYQQQLGTLSYWLLCQVQKILLPTELKRLLYGNTTTHIGIFIQLYKIVKPFYPFYLLTHWLLPKQHRSLLADMEKRMKESI